MSPVDSDVKIERDSAEDRHTVQFRRYQKMRPQTVLFWLLRSTRSGPMLSVLALFFIGISLHSMDE